jgi:Raf kinase inhibitor-like YbhB/YbcL family protein
MKIISSAFEGNGYIPAKYSKMGGNISPPLRFIDVSQNAKSLVLVCHDPDAPIEGGFTHWLVWNIKPETSEILEGDLPRDFTQGLNDWQTYKWDGPNPPSGTHRYNFYLYAIDINLGLSSDAKRPDLLQAINGHVIDTATLTGVFGSETTNKK